VGDTRCVESAYLVLEQHAPELVARFSSHGVLAFVSAHAQALLGEPPESLLGSSAFALIAAEDRAEVQRRVAALEQAGARDLCSVRMVRASGQLVPVQLALYAVRDADGIARSFVLVAREPESGTKLVPPSSSRAPSQLFSEPPSSNTRPSPEQLLRSESQLSDLLRSAQLCHLRLDSHGRVLRIDEAALQLLGYEQAGQLVGKHAQRMLWRGRMPLAEALAEAQRNGSAQLEVPLRCRDGTLCTVRSTLHVLRGDDGSVIAIDVLLRDVTDERRASWEVEHAREAAEAGSRAKSAFLANMSHQIRTPMNAILGMAHLALESDSLSKQREYLSQIQAAGGGLLEVVNDILDVSKIEAGKLELTLAPFELDRMLDTVANVVAVRAAERRLELVLAVDPALPESLLGDRARLTQVLMNLASNAVKFTDAGEIVIAIELVAARGQQVEVRFSVRDSGIGLSEEQQTRLFEPFSQLETSRRDRGTGLGLVIAQDLAHCMGGEIGVASAPGRGSDFHFQLTLAVPADSRPARERMGSELRDWRVLVAQASPVGRAALERSLHSLGFAVRGVGSVREGMALLLEAERKDEAYALVLVDAQLPAPGGVALAQSIAQHPWRQRRPELLMLADASSQEVANGRDLACVRAVLRKPISRSTLLDSLLDVADARRGGVRANSPPPPLVPATRGRPKPLLGLTLLVVEDNEINQILARDLLETAGARVVLAGDGQEAIKLCAGREPPFDLILMDVKMPGLDGHATTRILRGEAKSAHTPIIAMTAHAFDAERRKCLASGMNAHVSKPISPPELFRTVLAWTRPSAASATTAPAANFSEPTPSSLPFSVPQASPGRGAGGMPAPPPDFDPNALAAVFRDPDRQLSFLRKFIDSARLTLAELNGAWERRGAADIGFAGHKLKSSAKACGANALAALCAELEHRAKEGDWERLAPLQGRAEELLDAIARHVEAEEAKPAG
jgi:two-component system, sensor histidine kinase and response regulator